MKKVLALVLAVMMLATIAMAADVNNPVGGGDVANTPKRWIPGSTIKINDSGIVNAATGENANRYVLAADKVEGDGMIAVKNINSTNYSLSNVKYTDGKNLVESIKFNDANDRIDIKLKQDYTSTKAKALDVTFTLKGKKVGKTAKPVDIDVRVYGDVGYTLDKTSILLNDNDEATTPTNLDDDSILYEVDKDAGGNAYGTLEFDAADGDTTVSVRVYDGDKLYLYNDLDADTDILKKYADNDADITFLNFPGEPTFNSTATVYFYKEEGTYVYAIKNGQLTAVNAKWSDDDGAFVLKTRTLGSYVFSDKKLSVAATTPGSENPDTGANDVVGIATALAAVALVSAAAVSLKK